MLTLRWLIGSLLLAVVLTGCIVVPYPVAVGRPHHHRYHNHYGYPQGYR
jgi:hypothetical protein